MMHTVPNFESIGEIVAVLISRGYQLQFRREATCLYNPELNRLITPDDFTVDEFYHFEDNSNMDKDRTVYAISSTQGFRGYLVEPSYIYEDNISREMVQKLKWI